ncbi:EI24 domain-containing protein [Pseudooctadecabacter sp.]|uniref:EI24 domain-containing protein n=1 Tax=Pseudooctadecabacter sp. TaxID=1966338 RepID=UPI0035C82E6A
MIFSDIAKAIGQIGDPRFRRVLFLGIGLTLALLVAAYAAFLGLLDWIDPASFDLPFLGPNAFVGGLLSWGSIVLMLVLSIFLMIPVASAITSMFLEDVADAVEVRHYPHLPPAPRVSWGDAIRDTLSFLGLLVFVNLVALLLLPLYWFAAPLVFYLINGFLLGREYFTVAALRREGRAQAKALRRRHMGEIWFAGTLMAIPLTVPVLNLLVPILGAATFTHLYHRIAART